eukprot:3579236-Amphidinium_carterae.1
MPSTMRTLTTVLHNATLAQVSMDNKVCSLTQMNKGSAEPRLTMRECARPAMEDRETVEEVEMREIDNEFEEVEMRENQIDNEYKDIDEFEETNEYGEYKQQTLRLCSERRQLP